MEKRRTKRIKVNLKAERISGNEKYGVFIENISEHGIHIITTPAETHKKFTPGTDIALKFQLNTGETLGLQADRVASRLRGTRRGWAAHGEGQTQPILRHSLG